MIGIGAWKQRLPRPGEALPGRAEEMPLHNRHFVLGTPLRDRFEGLARIQFGMGCFWGVERRFWTMPGVVTTAAGYAGGHTPNPTYREVCSGQTGHAEVVLVVYDPARAVHARGRAGRTLHRQARAQSGRSAGAATRHDPALG